MFQLIKLALICHRSPIINALHVPANKTINNMLFRRIKASVFELVKAVHNMLI